jgi:type II secretory pathway pseudopilin PulG
VLWFLYHRLWVAALIVLVGLIALAGGGLLLGLPTGAGLIATLLAGWLIGLEASSLRRWTLARRGWPARDAVIASSSEEAEARALGRWLDANPAPPRAPFPNGPSRRSEAVIGLFPAHEGAR